MLHSRLLSACPGFEMFDCQFGSDIPVKMCEIFLTVYVAFTDCLQACPDGYTYTAPGAPSCGCVIPMLAQFRLGVKLKKLFPLVSELASELADGLFLETSQVRIVGANTVESNLDMTDVSADFVPLASKFDNTTANLLASRLWSGQVPLNKTYFGSCVIIFVTYPGDQPDKILA